MVIRRIAGLRLLGVGRPKLRISQQDFRNVPDNIDRFVKAYNGPENELPKRIARELERTDFVAGAMTTDELGGSKPADEILHFFGN